MNQLLASFAQFLLDWKWAVLLLPASASGILAGWALHSSDETRKTLLKLAVAALIPALGAWLYWDLSVVGTFRVELWGLGDLFLTIMAVIFSGTVMSFFWREMAPAREKAIEKLTKRTGVERNSKTDVRTVMETMPQHPGAFDPEKYWDHKKGFFIGLAADKRPIYWPTETIPHVQVAGTTGAGKGVVLSMLAGQCLARGEAVFYLDPKDDEWAPHVLAHLAGERGEPSYLIDLRSTAGAQLNPLENGTEQEIYELFLAGFGLSEKGTDADFYRLADRQAARGMARAAAGGKTAAALLAEHGEQLRAEAPGFAGYLQEMAELPSVNAKTGKGLNLEKVIEEGGVVYVVGSMRNASVMRMQKMLLVKLIQLAERRDRTAGKPRQVCIVLDELKYHISRPALEAFGAARDKGVHVILAHQSLADLKDCPADLNPDAVTGAILENGKVKIVYRVEDPYTAEWLARKSGKIQADDETRHIQREGLVERLEPRRDIRQVETYFVDENQILNLRPGMAVLYGAGLPQFVYTSPIKVQKSKLEPKIVAGDAVQDAAELIKQARSSVPAKAVLI